MSSNFQQERDKSIHLVFICDNNYALCTGVAITSLKENRDEGYDYYIHVIADQMEQQNKKMFLQLDAPGFHIDLIDTDTLQIDHIQSQEMCFAKHVSSSALYKFHLPSIFHNLDKVLYLDGDILIRDSLVELYQLDISKVLAAVCQDIGAETYPRQFHLRLGIDYKQYFNSGIMLLNLKRMRDEQITQQLVKYKITGVNDFMDQDALNVVFAEKVIYFSWLYNMTITGWYAYSCSALNSYYQMDMENKEGFYKKAKILHLCGPQKPWIYNNVIGAEEWWMIYSRSPFVQMAILRKAYHGSNEYRRLIEEEMTDTSFFTSFKTKPRNFDNDPCLSVVTPVYNSEEYLAECIESLIGQTLQNCEFIFVDDGSTDRSLELLDTYSKLDNRIRVYTQRNSYAGIARNNGMSHAQGKYITFLDADDVMHPRALELLYRRAETLNVDMVIGSAVTFSHDVTQHKHMDSPLRKKYLPKQQVFSMDSYPSYLLQVTAGMPWAKLYKRGLLEEKNIHFPALPRSEDISFTLWALAEAKSIASVEETIVYYRIVSGNGSLEDARDNHPLASIRGYNLLYEKYCELQIADRLNQTFINYMIDSIMHNLNGFRTGEALVEYVDCICNELLPKYRFDLMTEDYFYNKELYLRLQKVIQSGSGAEYLYAMYKQYKREADSHWDELKAIRANTATFSKKAKNSVYTGEAKQIGILIKGIGRRVIPDRLKPFVKKQLLRIPHKTKIAIKQMIHW